METALLILFLWSLISLITVILVGHTLKLVFTPIYDFGILAKIFTVVLGATSLSVIVLSAYAVLMQGKVPWL